MWQRNVEVGGTPSAGSVKPFGVGWTGRSSAYTSHTIGLSHNFNPVLQVRPEIGYYRNWTNPAFDNGNTKGLWLYGFDVTLRF